MLLATRLGGALSSLGHESAIAIADGPRIAAILARSLTLGERIVVAPRENAHAIASLPVAMLPLEASETRWLHKLGVRTIGELSTLPPAGLQARLGVQARDVLTLVSGEDRAPLTSYVPPEIPEEALTLEYGHAIEGTEALTFVTKRLCDGLAARLAGRSVSTARLELELDLDLAASDEPAPAPTNNDAGARTTLVALDLPVPLAADGDLLAALRPKIERLTLRAPVLGAKLRAASLVHKREVAQSLFEPRPKAERALPRLVAELSADLGSDAVGKLALGDSWVPEDRSRFTKLTGEEIDAARTKKPRKRRLLANVPEPTRLLAEPETLPREGLRIVRLLSRAASVEWWRLPPGAPLGSSDYVYAWTDEGAAWVEIARGSRTARVRGWFD